VAHKTTSSLAAEARARLDALAGRTHLSTAQRREIPVQEMPHQPPCERVRNMSEVALGYTPEQARLEALRCLECKNAPCIAGCPVGVNIPGFIGAIAHGDLQRALEVVKESNLLPAICGRVCPQETQCQARCVVGKMHKNPNRAVSIGRLERFVADFGRQQHWAAAPEIKPATGKKVGIVGSGPASLTAAADLRRAGHAVTIFEAFHKPGGVMIYGIPEFRLPKRIVDAEVEALIRIGVEIRTNFVVGRTRTMAQLLDEDGYDAIFIGTGAGLPKFMHVEGESLVGVYSANEYLTRVNLMRAYDAQHAGTPILRPRRVAVFGGGNVAMDSARSALRLGAEQVHLIYRRTEVEMPARLEEIQHAKEEGVQFHFLENAKRILGDEADRVIGVELLRYRLGEPDSSGRASPVAIDGSEFTLDVDGVIVAIGNDSNPLLVQATPGLKADKYGRIQVDQDLRTSLDRVYAGGDIVQGAATVIIAMGQGRRAARSINALLAG